MVRSCIKNGSESSDQTHMCTEDGTEQDQGLPEKKDGESTWKKIWDPRVSKWRKKTTNWDEWRRLLSAAMSLENSESWRERYSWLLTICLCQLTSGWLMSSATCWTWTLENGSMMRQRFCSRRLSYNVFKWAFTMGSSSSWTLYVTNVWNFNIYIWNRELFENSKFETINI